MDDFFGLIFQGFLELLPHLEIDLQPAFGFAICFASLAVASLLIALLGCSGGPLRNGLFAASSGLGIAAVISLWFGHLVSELRENDAQARWRRIRQLRNEALERRYRRDK